MGLTGLRPALDRLFAAGVSDTSIALDQLTLLVLLKWLSVPKEENGRPSEPVMAVDPVTVQDIWPSLIDHKDARALDPYVGADVLDSLQRASRQFGEPFRAAMRDISLRFPSPDALADVIRMIDQGCPDDGERYGDVFEELLRSVELTGRHGQLITPRPLVEAMVTTMAPRPDDRVLDPAAGTAGFLVAAREYARVGERSRDSSAYGTGLDLDATMVRVGATNLLLHGDLRPQMHHWDGLREDLPEGAQPADHPTVVLSNPPFTAGVDPQIAAGWLEVETPRAELLFVEACRRRLGSMGRAAIVVPLALLFNPTPAYVEIRERLLRQARIVAVAALPPGAFRPQADVPAAVLIFDTRAPTERVWFTERSNLRELVNSRRALDAPSPLPAPSPWWSADIDEILTNGASLLPAQYSSATRASGSDEARAILSDLLRMEDELRDRLARLERRLGAQ